MARNGDLIRAVVLRREGGEILVPLFACGPLLGAEARWDTGTNRWWLRGRSVVAAGFLDEPLVTVGGQPLLVRTPPRLVGKTPYLSLEALQLLGRHGWDTDIGWDEGAKQLEARPAQARVETGAGGSRGRPHPTLQVPPGARVLALDPGHPKGSGVRGLRGTAESDLGLRLAAAVAATLTDPRLTVVTLRGESDDLSARDVAGLANALPADLVVSFHASEWGEPGVGVWSWSLANLLGTGLGFDPYEPSGGWARVADGPASRSAALARRLAAALRQASVPARGPLLAPLTCLEGLTCPAVAVDVEGLGTPEGLAVVADETGVGRIASAIARVAAAALREGGPNP